MNGVAFDPDRSVWLVVADAVVHGIYASQAAALLALQDLARVEEAGA